MGESFLSTEVNYFLNFDEHPGDASDCYPNLSEIRRKFNELSQLLAFINRLRDRCKIMSESCEAARRKAGF